MPSLRLWSYVARAQEDQARSRDVYTGVDTTSCYPAVLRPAPPPGDDDDADDDDAYAETKQHTTERQTDRPKAGQTDMQKHTQTEWKQDGQKESPSVSLSLFCSVSLFGCPSV